jgi:hypothetical protein
MFEMQYQHRFYGRTIDQLRNHDCMLASHRFFIVEVELHFYNSISYPMLAKAICFLLLDAEIAHYADG